MTTPSTVASKLSAEIIKRTAKQIGDKNGDPNWWRYETQARALLQHKDEANG